MGVVLGRPARSLIELGTWHGGMALFLALQCRGRGMDFTTFDRADLVGDRWPLIEALGARRLVLDICFSWTWRTSPITLSTISIGA